MTLEFSGHHLAKTFNRRVIFENVSFGLRNGATMLVTGPNGSGKSTLVKILSGVLTPTGGDVKLLANGTNAITYLQPLIGLVAPYLQLYEEFSPRENLEFALAVRGMKQFTSRIEPLLHSMQLAGRVDDPVRTFSSGMKQRVKYAFALVHQPRILILDEPMANLDASGIEIVKSIMKDHCAHGILVVATNDSTDINRHDVEVNLGRTG